MPLLQPIDDAPGYLKATFQGPQGAGKTRTAVELAATVHGLFGSKKPIAFFDTETGSDYIANLITERTGQKPVRVKTRAFTDLLETVRECLAGASDVLIIDSITHVWRELGDGYMQKLNETLRYPKKRMEIHDIMAIKKQWEPWPDMFVNCPLHIIVCGREGSEWGSEEDEESGKQKLVQTGKKMKVEGEFGYEGSLSVSMSIRQEAEIVRRKRGGKKEREPRTLVNVATVIKDRFDVLNGQQFDYPTGEHFLPHLKLLRPDQHRPVDMSIKSGAAMGDVSDSGYGLERHKRTVLCEEIQAELVKHYPGMSAKEKAFKATLIDQAFGTRSWTRVESMDSNRLGSGLAEIRNTLIDKAAFEKSTEPQEIPLAGGQ